MTYVFLAQYYAEGVARRTDVLQIGGLEDRDGRVAGVGCIAPVLTRHDDRRSGGRGQSGKDGEELHGHGV